MEITGEAGAGLVKVVMTGRHDVRSISIDDKLFNRTAEGDSGAKQARAMIQDLVAAAVNDANRKIEDETRNRMMAMAQGMDLPEDVLKQMQDQSGQGDN